MVLRAWASTAIVALAMLGCGESDDAECEDTCAAFDACGFLPSLLGDQASCRLRCERASENVRSSVFACTDGQDVAIQCDANSSCPGIARCLGDVFGDLNVVGRSNVAMAPPEFCVSSEAKPEPREAPTQCKCADASEVCTDGQTLAADCKCEDEVSSLRCDLSKDCNVCEYFGVSEVEVGVHSDIDGVQTERMTCEEWLVRDIRFSDLSPSRLLPFVRLRGTSLDGSYCRMFYGTSLVELHAGQSRVAPVVRIVGNQPPGVTGPLCQGTIPLLGWPCEGFTSIDECRDGEDNDKDGRADDSDPACAER